MQELTHIVETITIKGQPMMYSTESEPRLEKLSRRPPYVTPQRYPNEIISDYFSFEERERLIDVISNKQRTGNEWDVIRAKLPENFLDKIKRMVKDCWENGFCNPRVREGKLIWSQITGRRGNDKHREQCDLCRNSFQAGTCKGSAKVNFKGQRNFKKCWEGV